MTKPRNKNQGPLARNQKSFHKAWNSPLVLSLLVCWILSVAPSASARTLGGAIAASKPSPLSQPLFGLRHKGGLQPPRSVLEGSTTIGFIPLLRWRGGSSPFRPTPRDAKQPFRKAKESTKHRGFRPGINIESKDDETTEPSETEREDTKEMIDAFLTRDSRNSFIARVYGILSAQLAFTALVCLLFGTYPPLTNIYNSRSVITGATSPLLWAPLAGIIASTIAWFRIAISPKARQKSPNKWWWLAIFTVGEAISVGAVSSLYELRSVIMAMGTTALATVTVSMYTIMQDNPNRDLSQWGATLSSWTTILLVYMLVGLAQSVGWLPSGFLPYSDMMFSVLATGLFSLYLAYHTKLIVGGKHSKYRMNEKDYVFGAMALYVDIVNIFLHILKIMGQERD